MAVRVKFFRDHSDSRKISDAMLLGSAVNHRVLEAGLSLDTIAVWGERKSNGPVVGKLKTTDTMVAPEIRFGNDQPAVLMNGFRAMPGAIDVRPNCWCRHLHWMRCRLRRAIPRY